VATLKLTLTDVSAHLEVPLAQLDALAARLGCAVKTSSREVTLLADDVNCALTFDRVDALLLLREARVIDDENGLFAVNVLGRLLSIFEGDLEAAVVTTPANLYPTLLSVQSGESSHPLFATIMPALTPVLSDAEVERVERLLDEASAAWAQWQRSKDPSSPSPRSSG